jgi:DNA-binding NarL/FixJ family response regulator
MTKAKPTPAKTIQRRVLVVDDHPMLREGIVQRLKREPDLIACAEAEDGPQALEAIEAHKPHIAVVDISLGQGHGLELIKEIQARHPHLPILVFSMHEESLYAERALNNGARGYVMKRESPQTFLTAIRQVLAGDMYFSPAMTGKLLGRIATGARSETSPPVKTLSDREQEIFDLLGQGYGTVEIARQLGISAKTVSSHRESLKQKLNVTSGQALLRLAIHAAKR